MNDDRNLPRRVVLKRAALLTGAGLMASVLPGKTALAQGKVSKSAMKYQDTPEGGKKCSDCLQFDPPASCKIVEGVISPNGYCLAWVKKP